MSATPELEATAAWCRRHLIELQEQLGVLNGTKHNSLIEAHPLMTDTEDTKEVLKKWIAELDEILMDYDKVDKEVETSS